MTERRKRASTILYSQMNSVAPSITAKAASKYRRVKESHSRGSMPAGVLRSLQLGDDERDEVDDYINKRSLLARSLTSPAEQFRRLSDLVMKDYGTMDSFVLEDIDEEE